MNSITDNFQGDDLHVFRSSNKIITIISIFWLLLWPICVRCACAHIWARMGAITLLRRRSNVRNTIFTSESSLIRRIVFALRSQTVTRTANKRNIIWCGATSLSCIGCEQTTKQSTRFPAFLFLFFEKKKKEKKHKIGRTVERYYTLMHKRYWKLANTAQSAPRMSLPKTMIYSYCTILWANCESFRHSICFSQNKKQ